MAVYINSLTGERVDVPEHYFGHPVLGAYLKPLENVETSDVETKIKKNKVFSLGERTSTENNEE